jgi:CHAT domain-containing protein/uncharacterized protein HemY
MKSVLVPVFALLFTFTTSLLAADNELLQMQQKYEQHVAEHGKMSGQANELREEIIEYFWEDKEFVEPLPYLRDTWAWYEQEGIKGKRKGQMRSRLAKSLRVAGYFEEALPLAKESYEHGVDNKGVGHRSTIKKGVEYGIILSNMGEHEQAIALLKEQLQNSINAWSESHPRVGYANLQLGGAYDRQGNYPLAEKHLKEAFQIYDLKKGRASRQTNLARLKLGKLYRHMGQYEKSEKVLRRAYVRFSSKEENQKHQLTSHIMTHLGRTLMKQGRYGEAEELLKEGIAIKEAKLGRTSQKLYQTMLTLANIYLEQKKSIEAEQVATEVLTRMEGNTSELNKARARANMMYGRALLQQGKYDEAKQGYDKLKKFLEHSPSELPLKRRYLVGAGTIQLRTANYKEAEAIFTEALELTIKLKGDYTPDTAKVKAHLAQTYAKLGRYEEAINTYRSAMAASSGFLAQRETYSKAARAQQEAATNEYLKGFMNLMVDAQQSGKKVSANPVAESFTIAENARGQSLQSAMLGMTARAAARNDYLSELVRKEQDIRLRIGQIDEEMVELVKQGQAANLKQLPRLGGQRKELTRELKKIGEEMSYQYPEYNRLMNPPATQLTDVQALLAADELMLSYHVQPNRTILWVIGNDTVSMHVVPLGAAVIGKKVQKLRASLDVPIATLNDIPAYDVQLAYDLYQALVAPAGERLGKARHLILVPHQALLSMPFGALVSAETTVKKATLPFAEYKTVPWLAEKYAISIMPSATALVTMRKYAKGEKPSRPFIGFGDPVFGESVNQAAVATRGVRVAQRAVINTRSIRGLPNLPETRDELKKIALTLGASEDSLFLGEEANEPNVKGAELKDYRVIAFATHGLVAGDLDGLEQPALALTPPSTGTEENDGLLQMGEVLGLDLNADWVVLSACNTASGDKALANEGLTGLTQAFFYAGSKAMLVSLWPVESTSTQKLTTTMFEAAKNDPNLGRAASLQLARKRLIEGEGYMYEGKEAFSYAHPIFWSAFIAVGEGGAN